MAKIEATIAPTTFTLAAGDTVEATATLRNLGQTIDQLTVHIEGLDANWYTLPVSSVALFPNDQDSLKIILHPPKTDETKAGSYPFRINIVSAENPDERKTVDLAIRIEAPPELELTLSPQVISGRRGSYQIVVNNPSRDETSLKLSASDAQGKLRYRISPESLKVPGSGRSEATLEVRPSWLTILFTGQRKLDFKVVTTTSAGEDAGTIGGQLDYTPWYAALRIRLPWMSRPPVISSFKATTEDRREFKLSWSAKRATEVKLEDEDVEPQGDRLVKPAEATSYVLRASNKYGSLTQTVEVKPLPLPKAKASERIRASLSPTAFQVQAGGIPASAMLELQNLGEIVDKFLVEIEGLDETWYSRSASSVALMPQATDQVQISFNPPKKKGVKSKTYPFAVVVRSQSAPEDVTSIVGQLEILPSIEFKLGVHPHRVSCRRKGTFKIDLTNTGVSDAILNLEATDLDEGLKFRFENEKPPVTAWKSIEVPMIARPKRGSMVGEKKRYDITVTATTTEGNPQTINCELYHNPFIGSWKFVLRVVRAIVVIAAIGVLIYFIIQWGGGWHTLRSSPQTWINQLVNTFQGWFSK